MIVYYFLSFSRLISSSLQKGGWDFDFLWHHEWRVACDFAQNMVNVCSFDCIRFIVVPVTVLKVQVIRGSIAKNDHVCKMCHGASERVFGILIFDKRTLVFQVCVFWSCFLNQIHFARCKVGRINELKRSHGLDVFITWFYLIWFNFYRIYFK